MKFQIAINLERMDASQDMASVRDHTLEMVQMADRAGFETVWAAEHHALEMTIAPNPFQLLTWWAGHTSNIRLGCGVANAAYWHPINLAGEAAMLDLISGGRLDLGLGSGAYQREFDRMKPGLDQKDSWRYMQEMLPLVRELEAEAYRTRLDEAVAKAGKPFNGDWALMRHTGVYTTDADRQATLDAVRSVLGMFGNLMMKAGDVVNGFPEKIPFEQLDGNVRVDPDMLEANLVFGSPEAVTEKIRGYETLGVDAFIYYASMGLDHDVQKRSLQTFIDRVMPAFTEN